MATPKKINPKAKAPELIKKIQAELFWTQKDLEQFLVVSQQTVSNYKKGRVDREQHGIIVKLRRILAKKLPPPSAEEVIEDAESDDLSAGGDEGPRPRGPKTAGAGAVPARRNGKRERRA